MLFLEKIDFGNKQLYNYMGKKNKILRTDFLVEESKIIQDNIKRMSSNSFLIKGWTITLFSGILLFTDSSRQIMLFMIIPIILFWYIDAYFLRQERLFREIYNWVIENRLKTDAFLFDLNTNRFKDKVASTIRLVFSKSLFLFYITMLFMIIIIWVLSYYKLIS